MITVLCRFRPSFLGQRFYMRGSRSGSISFLRDPSSGSYLFLVFISENYRTKLWIWIHDTEISLDPDQDLDLANPEPHT
jgi:hypothetical protein